MLKLKKNAIILLALLTIILSNTHANDTKYKYLTKEDLKILEWNGITDEALERERKELSSFSDKESHLYKTFLVYKKGAEFNFTHAQKLYPKDQRAESLQETLDLGQLHLYLVNEFIKRGSIKSDLPDKYIKQPYNSSLLYRLDFYSNNKKLTDLANRLCKEFNNFEYDTTAAETNLEKYFLNEYNYDRRQQCTHARLAYKSERITLPPKIK